VRIAFEAAAAGSGACRARSTTPADETTRSRYTVTRARARQDRLQRNEQNVQDDERAEDAAVALGVDLGPEERGEHDREHDHERGGRDEQQSHDARIALARAKRKRRGLHERDQPGVEGADRLAHGVAF
jgi:hypothetical protein